MFEQLKETVCRANLALVEHKLVIFTWGNVSGIDRQKGIVAIKPSGVSYDALTPEKIVLLDMEGKVIEGDLRPSSDTPTHLELYRCFPEVGGVCHTHSPKATAWAQACREIPALGTTHADHFYGPVPATDMMTQAEIEGDYELNTGKVIVRRFAGIDPMSIPAVLVSGHGPFTWGKNADKAVENAAVLEQVAAMAFETIALNPGINSISRTLLDKHYLRKHGKNAYYGQK
jgi:L-ribulose-5-phosphate 4-epimerase